MKVYNFISAQIPDEFFWLNEPKTYFFERGLHLVTKSKTDFWQKTHYGFQRDDGHCLLTNIQEDFSLKTRVQFNPKSQYDQCGLIARIDSENWIKCSIEYENEEISRLGSVVTNYGFSDWSTQDISSDVKSAMYRLSKRSQDFLLEYSLDGIKWHQMRIAHLHDFKGSIDVGVYACSPIGEEFQCKFDFIEIDKNNWHYQEANN
ncbi:MULTISPECIES: DUF1349 domain-containing protein [Aerosakkonema]|uniref:DUF1349 domain-containing protein n=1 Tax=Aerosakkonema TaxID=1246629 RepID=UPI0035B729A4